MLLVAHRELKCLGAQGAVIDAAMASLRNVQFGLALD